MKTAMENATQIHTTKVIIIYKEGASLQSVAIERRSKIKVLK